MKSLVTALIAATLVLGGCATGEPKGKPDWVAGNSSKYPDTRFLVGRGQGGNQDDAGNRARADLAKIFQVNIAVSTEDVVRHESARVGDKGDSKTESEVTRTIVTQTDQIVRGIRIADLWQDPVNRTYHALAVLPRLQAGNSLRQEIDRLDNATDTYVNKARNSGDLLLSIAAASKALDSQIERAAYQKSLKIVDTSGQGIPERFAIARLASDLDGLLKRVKVSAKVGTDSIGGLDTLLAGGLSAAGFMVETGERPDYSVEASLMMDDLGMQQGWYWLRGNLEVKLVEVASGRVRGTQRWEIKVSGQQKATAQQRARSEAEGLLKTQLRGTIIRFATST